MIVFFVVSVRVDSGGDVNFLTLRNSQNILVAIVPVLLLGLGQTFVIIASGIDLSVGYMMNLGSVVSALAIRSVYNGGAPSICFCRRRVSGGGCDHRVRRAVVQGGIIAKLKVPAFIVTLGGSFIVRGVALLLSENTTVIGLPRGIRDYGNESIIYMVSGSGGGIYFFHRPDVTGAVLRSMDRIFTYPVVITAIIIGIAILF